MNEEQSFIYLTDDTGAEVPFEYLDLVEYEGREYVVLLPADAPEDAPAEVVILRIEQSGDEEYEDYVGVEDEDEELAVFELFKQRFAEDFNFVDVD